MSILLIGGTGLIGTHLARALRSRGTAVTVASRSQPTEQLEERGGWIRCDVRDSEQVASACRVSRAEKIVHLAAALQFSCDAEPSLSVETNIVGTANVLAAARAAGVERVLFASSIAVYGDTQELLRESMLPAASASIYGQAKWFEEQLGIRCAAKSGFRFIALRYSGVFGSGASTSAGMAQVRQRIELTRLGKSIIVPEASGNERAQLTYVRDAVDATLAALDAIEPRQSIYNVGGPQQNYLSLREYHAALRELYPSAGDVTFAGQARGAGPLDISRIRDDLGFVPRFSVSDGLREMFGQDQPRS